MTKKILHSLLFITVMVIVAASIINADPNDPAKLAAQLPALLLAALYFGVLFVVYVLPVLTDRATNAVLASNEGIERDPMNDARAAVARGDYEDAIEFYREATEHDPSNRLPWVEISKIQHDQLEDPEAALDTMQTALDDHEWPEDDVVFFMGRIADIQLDDLENPDECADILNQIVELFPGTRHSANATHKLREMGRL